MFHLIAFFPSLTSTSKFCFLPPPPHPIFQFLCHSLLKQNLQPMYTFIITTLYYLPTVIKAPQTLCGYIYSFAPGRWVHVQSPSTCLNQESIMNAYHAYLAIECLHSFDSYFKIITIITTSILVLLFKSKHNPNVIDLTDI